MSRILVADDEEYITSLIYDCLTAEGYEVTTVDNGLLAYQAFKQSRFDLVITDVIMPELDGLELIKKIKNEQPEIRIIAMSAGGDLLEADLYLNPAKTFGADKRINKPFDLDELTMMVKSLVSEPLE